MTGLPHAAGGIDMVLPDGTDRLGKGTFRTMRAELLPAAFADSMRALLGDEEYTSYIRSFGEDWKPGAAGQRAENPAGAVKGHASLAAGAGALGGNGLLL